MREHALGDFNAITTTFPAAEYLGGTVDNTGFTYIDIDPGPNQVIDTVFPPSSWTFLMFSPSGLVKQYYAEGSNMPTEKQLIAVAAWGPMYYSNVPCKGAAAANWPHDTCPRGYAYLSGELLFNKGFFWINAVDMDDGSPYGAPLTLDCLNTVGAAQ